MKVYDVIIVGAGLSGLSAGWILNMHRSIDYIVIADELGGKIVESPFVNLFPFVRMSGKEMIEWFLSRIPKERIIQDRVIEIDISHNVREVICESGKKYYCRGLILATGGVIKPLKLPDGRIINCKYCVLCELPFLKGKHVLIVYDNPYYLSVVQALKGVCTFDILSRADITTFEKKDGKYIVNGKEYDEVFYLSEPLPKADIKGLPNTRPDYKFRIAPMVYVVGDALPQKSIAIFSVASGIVSALNILDDLYVFDTLSVYFAGELRVDEKNIPEIKSERELEDVIRRYGKVLVVWHTVFCSPCFVYENVLKLLVTRVKDVKVYMVDANAIDCKKYGVRVVPTSIYYVNGNEVWRREGIIKLDELVKLIDDKK